MKSIIPVFLLCIAPTLAWDQPQDFRYVPGEIHLDLDKEIDIAWAFNQAHINQDVAGPRHWRPATKSDRMELSMPDNLRCIALADFRGTSDGLCWPNNWPDNESFSRRRAMFKDMCGTFNRRLLDVRGRVLVCGEPRKS